MSVYVYVQRLSTDCEHLSISTCFNNTTRQQHHKASASAVTFTQQATKQATLCFFGDQTLPNSPGEHISTILCV